ncbi:MAG: cytochrome c biogenesis protein CcsA [Pelosinus sp.]|nr:cytochrome c biogenesis protein CcsA [Pelosinus sp.]
MIGYSAIFLALIMTCIACFSYFNSHMACITKPSSKNKGRRTPYYLAAALVLVAALYLLYIILADQFEFMYVAGYSSRDLPLVYKLSVFWAGQEGSFMLWLVFHTFFGMLLSRKATPGVMAVYSALQVMLLIILLAKSPFMMLSQPRAEGFGLNPLLQDPWMVIHPPILFLGYASLAVPFAYAMNGLMSRKHSEWLSKALSWTLFAWAMLGAGIFIGAYWSYKVLGWGGYWAWDPVENSSLVPWLIAGMLVHTIILAKIKPAGIGLTYFSAIFSFVSVLYGTFLTRSGILSNFSTHSFLDEGTGSILAGFVLITLCASLILFIVRLPDLPKGELASKLFCRESLFLATTLVLGILAVVVFIGMSTPLITMLIGNPQSVQSSFYNTVALPLAGCISMLLMVMPLLSCNKTKVWFIFAVAAGAITLPLAYDLKQTFVLLAVCFAAGAILSNLWLGYKKNISSAAAITHTGLAIMIIGIIISSAGSRSLTMNFEKEQKKEVFGYNLTYLGQEKAEEGHGIYQLFEAENQKEKAVLKPYTKLNKDDSPAAREPGIYRSLTADLYIAPSTENGQAEIEDITLHKGESASIGGLRITFVKLSMSGMGSSDVRVEASLEVVKDGKKEEISPELSYRGGHISGQPVTAFGEEKFMLYSISPGEEAATFAYQNRASSNKNEKIAAEISQKPLINLVWLGACLITAGTILASLKRAAR